MQAVSCAELSRELRITADTAMLSEAREWAGSVAGEFGLDEDGCFAVRLAMTEAVTNAILHGSSSPDDPVGLRACERNEGLVFEVRDTAGRSGVNFDRLAGGGRGLGLVALMTDEMQLTCDDNGSVLRFVKRR